MLEIKTIIETIGDAHLFDREVNAELEAGWELVRRDIIPAQSPERHVLLYAELEREVETEEEYELDDDDNLTSWQLIRNPVTPYRCEKCGYKSTKEHDKCPECQRVIRRTE